MKQLSILICFIFSILCSNFAYPECNTRCCEEEYPRLTVTGEGKIEILADKAYFNVRARAEEKKLEKAFEVGTEKINSIQEVLKSFEVKKEDIRNIGYVYHPLYQGKRFFTTINKPTSYEVFYSLRVTMYDMDKLGKILARLSEIEETTVFGIKYTSKNIEEFKQEVLKEAAKDAREKALKLVEGAGATLGKAMEIKSHAQEYAMTNIVAEERGYLRKSIDKAEMKMAPQLESGYIEVRGSCTISYSIN